MKNGNRVIFSFITLVTAASLTACGGGGGGGTVGTGGGGGGGTSISGAVVSQGALTKKGSVFVNGVEFKTDGATIRINDAAASEAELKVGMVMKVRGTIDNTGTTGTAALIEARDALQGTVSSVDAVNNTITVMGQTVRIEDNVTRLNDDDAVKTFAAAAFQVNDKVEVHGFADDLGGIRASRVVKNAQAEFEMKGLVTGLSATSFGLTLAPGGASTVTVNFTAGLLPAGAANGSLVQVKGATPPTGTPPALTASSIKLENDLAAVGEKVEVEGLVTSGTVDSFAVNGRAVVTTATTVFEGGLRSDFAVGSKIEAQGSLGSNGVITATRIEFRSNIRIEADASAVTASGLTVLGKPVAIDKLTRIDNGPLANGQHLEVRAFPDRDGNIVASRVIVKNADTRAFLQGPVTAASSTAGTLTILGTTIDTTGAEFRASTDTTEAAITAAAFFAKVTTNVTVVKVRWNNFTSTTQSIKEAEIEEGK
jgi:Domain of unknown function (DUF5666)